MTEYGFGWRRAYARAVVSLARGAAVAFLVAVAGCASIGGLTKDSPPEAKQAAVAVRAEARFAALIDGNLDLAYTFLSPASKEIVSLGEFKRQARTGYRAAKAEKVQCNGAICSVELKVTYDHRLMKGLMTPLNEKWVIEEGTAWLIWGQ